MAATVYGQDFFRHMNEAGLAKLRWCERTMMASQPGTWWLQSSTGHTIGTKYQGWEIGFAGGVSYLDGRVSPMGQISVRNDAIALSSHWETLSVLDDEGNCILTDEQIAEIKKAGGELVYRENRLIAAGARIPSRIWAVSADFSAMPRQYASEAVSKGKTYLSLKARLNLEHRIVENKWSTFQLYGFVSGGFLLEHHDKLVASIEEEDAVREISVQHYAFGWTWGGGLRANVNLKHSPISFFGVVRADAQPLALLNRTNVKCTVDAYVGISISLMSKIR